MYFDDTRKIIELIQTDQVEFSLILDFLATINQLKDTERNQPHDHRRPLTLHADLPDRGGLRGCRAGVCCPNSERLEMEYPLVIYANWPVPERFAGTTYGPLCFIRPEYRDDDGLRAHESLHATDWWRFGLAGVAVVALLDWLGNNMIGTSALPYVFAMCLYSFLYLLVPDFKLWAEARCYARQALYYADDRRPLFASFISSNYGLNVTNADALTAIREAT